MAFAFLILDLRHYVLCSTLQLCPVQSISSQFKSQQRLTPSRWSCLTPACAAPRCSSIVSRSRWQCLLTRDVSSPSSVVSPSTSPVSPSAGSSVLCLPKTTVLSLYSLPLSWTQQSRQHNNYMGPTVNIVNIVKLT